MAIEKSNLSHGEINTLEDVLVTITNKITQRGDLPYASIVRQLELLRALSQFEVGKFLLQKGGLNGYWTDYVINHPTKGRLTGLNSENQSFSQLEWFLLDQAPTALATQQRFDIFKKEIQKRLHNGIVLASIPCGLTADLLDLDFSQYPNFSIVGIDIDTESLIQSQQRAEKRKIAHHCQFFQRDAWALENEEEFDIITSNGLSIYEPDHRRVVKLYTQFFSALKPNGWLITGFLTPPPVPGTQTEWDLKSVSSEHALLQKIIFSDILNTKWQVFRSEEVVRSQLIEAGFSEIEMIYDTAHIFPTIIGRKLG